MNGKGYKAGDPWFECAICGFLTRYSQGVKNWQGFLVCKQDWDPKPPHLLPQQPAPPAKKYPGIIPPNDTFLDSNDYDIEDL